MTIFVGGVIANKYLQGGAVWTRLNWILGLKQLGFDVHFVEQIDRQACVDASGAITDFERSANLRYFQRITDEFGLTGSATLLYDNGEQSVGLPLPALLDLAAESALLVNIAGHVRLRPLLARFKKKAYIDLDPGYLQAWHAEGIAAEHLDDHDFHFTVGENIGAPDCPIPTGGIAWRPIRQPVVLDEWPVVPDGRPDRFTTIASWRGPFAPVTIDGQTSGSKVHEFRKFITLPGQAPQQFELALDIHPNETADLRLLAQHGWRVAEARSVVPDPDTFRAYVQASGGEFSVAQATYVHTQSGWFSDRTVRYLASGKPVLVQDTGFSRNLPVGEGLLAFRTIEEARRGAVAIATDYDHHRRLARALAEEYFESGKVLGPMLEAMDVSP